MIAGTSLTYIWNNEQPKIYQNEITWNINVGISISKRIFSGIQVLNIYQWETAEPKEYYNIYGLFTQYNFLRRTDHRFFAEISINRGNYNCFTEEKPFRENNLYFAGIGFGYDLPIKFVRGLYLDLSFISYYNLFPFQGMDGDYNQYIAGLNYRFIEK
jgi:hypothetical protein